MVKFKLEGVPEPYGPRPNPTRPGRKRAGLPHRHTAGATSRLPITPCRFGRLFPSGYGSDRQASTSLKTGYLARIESFNRDGCLFGRGGRQQLISRRGRWINCSLTAKGILDWFSVADPWPCTFNRTTAGHSVVLVVLSVAAAVFLQVSSRGRGETGMVRCLPDFLGLALLPLYFLTRWHGSSQQVPGLPRLAEGLRVQFFWWLAGIHDSVADHYLRKQRGELDWIRQAIRMRTIQATSDNVRLQPGERFSPSGWHWFSGTGSRTRPQYFERSSRKLPQRSRVIRWVGYGAMRGAGRADRDQEISGGRTSAAHLAWVYSLASLPALLVYAKVQAYAEHSKHYERMRELFERAERNCRIC